MLGSFITVDEMGEWFPAGAKLLPALQAREYLDTVLVGHPGVTTMWLSAIGDRLHHLLALLGWVRADDPDVHRTLLRLPVAVMTSSCIGCWRTG